MPGLFSRRRGSSAQPPVNRSTTSAATAAASQAYINLQNTSLSSSAAAAALRSHTSSPEPVGNLVTKRMVRRGSTSSNTASNGRTSSLQARGGHQRTNSFGSMTERTFRSVSPSPNRGTPSTVQSQSQPPVPSIPRTLRSGNRAGSTEPPARVTSPTPARTMRSASVDQTNLKAQNRSSLNFSRPRISSPEPNLSEQAAARKQSTIRKSVQTEPDNNAQTTAKNVQASAQPSTNKNVHTSGGWFAGPVGAASTSKPSPIKTSNEEMEEVMVYDANSRTFVRTLRPKAKVEPPSPVAAAPPLKPGEYDPATRRIVPHPQPVKDPAEKTASPRPHTLHKQPSMVPEEPEAERAAEQAPAHVRSQSLDVPNGRGRGGSLSPSRNTRFSASPIVTNVIHEPPRGLSPVKSAMKHSPSSSVRTASPVTTFSPTNQDVSDTTSLTSAEGSASGKKRRSVRVSFGDAPVPKAAEKAESEDDLDDYSKPRPVLPSFGSVRKSAQNNDPLPPDVTSKDVADHSDDEAPADVPAINLHPPTPGIDETPKELVTDDESSPNASDTQAIRTLAQGVVRYGDESDSSSANHHSTRFVSKKSDTNPSTANDTSPKFVRKDSDADVYSDAPETQAAGFASLDAIVESPVKSDSTRETVDNAQSELPKGVTQSDTGTANSTSQPDVVKSDGTSDNNAEPDTAKPVDWSTTSTHWNNAQQNAQAQLSGDEKKSKLSFFKRKQKKDSKDRPGSPASTNRPVSPVSNAVIDVKAPETAPEVVPTSTETHAQTSTDIPAQTPAQPLPESTAPANSDSTPIATSDSTPVQPNSTTQAAGFIQQSNAETGSTLTKDPAKARQRHSVQPIKTAQPLKSALKTPSSPTGMPKTMRNRPASVGSPATNGPRRFSYTTTPTSKLRNDSDSESSFKKKRKVKNPDRSMRRSMRAGSIDSGRPMSPASESVRSMRSSLRGPPPRTMRKTTLKSRLADSDSEDERPAYRSRFVDSDDDTILEELPPVRGIPKRKGQEDGDSTDLEDESDAERTKLVINPADVEKAMELARKKLGMTEQRDRDQDKVLISDVMSDAGSEATSRRRRSFMRGFRRKQSPPPIPRLKRGDSSFSTATAPVRTEDWPLPPPMPQNRPHSAERPQNGRSFSARVGFTDEAIAQSEKAESVDVVFSQRTGRKKRFGLLRRAFGLYD